MFVLDGEVYQNIENMRHLYTTGSCCKLNYSSAYLSRIVRKYTGLSLLEYEMSFRMREAARLLSITKAPVSEIMADL